MLLRNTGRRALLFTMLSARLLCMMRMTCNHGTYTKTISLATIVSPRECRRRCAGFQYLVVHVMHKDFRLEVLQAMTVKEIALALRHINSLKALTIGHLQSKKPRNANQDQVKELHRAIRTIARAVRRLNPHPSELMHTLFSYLQKRGTKGLERLCTTVRGDIPCCLPDETTADACTVPISSVQVQEGQPIDRILHSDQQLTLPMENR